MPDPKPSIRTILSRILNSDAGRAQPASVLFRFALWQTWRRVVRRPMRFRILTGPVLRLLPNASGSLSGFWYLGLPDFEELAFTLHLLRPGDLFVDVGANQGGWSLAAAGRGARVFAFEPVPVTRERLEANISANADEVRERISVFPCGLSSETGRVRFTADFDAGNHRIGNESDSGVNMVDVDLERADNALRGECPVMLKIDVEGEELGVLKGARAVLSASSLLAVVMETFRPQNFGDPALIEAEAILAEHGFTPMGYSPGERKLSPLVGSSDGMQNTIYVRSPDIVGSRLKVARPLKVFGREI